MVLPDFKVVTTWDRVVGDLTSTKDEVFQ